MKDQNKVTLTGRIGNNPELTELESGKKVARASLATSSTYKDASGNLVESTQWHNLVFWNKEADFVKENISKGNQITVEGSIQYRTYQDKEDNTRYVTEIVVKQVVI